MALVVVVPDGVSLGELQEGHLGRHHPAQQEAEQEVVPERQDELALPVQGAGVPVVPLAGGDVLHKLAALQGGRRVLVEPGLPPPPDLETGQSLVFARQSKWGRIYIIAGVIM